MKIKNTLLCLCMLSACAPTTPNLVERKLASTIKSGKIFEDVTDESGMPNLSGSAIAVFDYDRDQFPDFIVGNHLIKNVSTKESIRFVDVTEQMGLTDLKGNVIWLDFDNDGFGEIISTTGQIFKLNSQKKFEEVSKRYHFSLPEKVHTISFGDIDRDGYPEIIAGMNENHVDNSFTFLPPHIYQNLKGKGFLEISNRFSFDRYPAYTRGILWADYNNDSYPEIYFANYRLRENFFFKVRPGNMTEVSGYYNVKGTKDPNRFYDQVMKKNYGPSYGHSIGGVWADFNNDGNFDLWISNLVHKYVGTSNGGYDYRGYVCDDSKVYKNTGAPYYQLEDVRSQIGIPYMPIGDWSKYKGDELWAHTTSSDFDNDGLIDLYITQVYNLKYAYSLLVKNLGNFKFKDVGENEPTRTFDSYAGAFADFNNDGKMDLVVSGREVVDAPHRLKVFKNIVENNYHYLKIRLNGTKSGKSPVTTKVKVVTDRGIFLRQFEGVTGTMNQQNDPTLHFGLGNIDKIKYLEVNWNSGKKQIINGIKVDQTYNINEL